MALDSDTQRQVDIYFTEAIESVGKRRFRDTVRSLKNIFDLIPKHPTHIATVVNGLLTHGLDKRGYAQILEMYTRKFPSDPSGYSMKAKFHRDNDALEQVRQTWRDAAESASGGFHFQPVTQASLFDAEKGQRHTAIGTPDLGGKIADTLRSPDTASPADESGTNGIGSATSQNVITKPAEPIDGTTAALNGVVEGICKPTRYYFKYGHDAANLDRRTEPDFVPGSRNGRVADLGDNLFRSINAYASHTVFALDKEAPISENTRPPTKMVLGWPFGKDRNHKDGIGIIDLLLGWRPAARDIPHVKPDASGPKFPSKTYPGEALDLRDAEFSVLYRSDNLDQQEFRPVAWIHGRTGTSQFPESWDDLAAWAVTGPDEPAPFSDDGKWHCARFPLPAHSDAWTFCGSNIEEMGDSMGRYTYAPIQDQLRNNAGGNICICFVGGDELDTPEGHIEIAALELRYRSRSLLSPGWGTALTSEPDNPTTDPKLLTDGTIRIPDHFWFADPGRADECTLTWTLRETAEIECFKIHQNPIAPAREIEIMLSGDGNTFETACRCVLDDVPIDVAGWADAAAKGEGSGLCRIVLLETAIAARFIRLRILSSYHEGRVGLDAVEVFGAGVPPMPDGDRFTCSALATGLSSTTSVYAQLVTENEDGVVEGEIVQLDMPAENAPQILDVRLIATNELGTALKVRTRAGGTNAVLTTSLLDRDGADVAVKSLPVGTWNAPRDGFLRFPVPSGAVAKAVCRIENEYGVDESSIFLA